MGGKRVLVPFNFTDYDEKALHYLIRNFADQRWVKVTLFHVYTPLPDINGYANPTLSRLKSTLASMWKELREREADLKRAREDLMANGFSDEQLDYVFRARAGSVGAEIVTMAQTGNFDTVILSHKPSKAVPAFRRSVHDKVLSSLKDRTISIIL